MLGIPGNRNSILFCRNRTGREFNCYFQSTEKGRAPKKCVE